MMFIYTVKIKSLVMFILRQIFRYTKQLGLFFKVNFPKYYHNSKVKVVCITLSKYFHNSSNMLYRYNFHSIYVHFLEVVSKMKRKFSINFFRLYTEGN